MSKLPYTRGENMSKQRRPKSTQAHGPILASPRPLIPDRRPMFFTGSLSNQPGNPHNFNPNWASLDQEFLLSWLFGVINEGGMNAERVVISDPAGQPFPDDGAGQVRWPHWHTLNDQQRYAMTGALGAWRTTHPEPRYQIGIYQARRISPKDSLLWVDHIDPDLAFQHFVTDSLLPYSDLTCNIFGFDAATTLTLAQWEVLTEMVLLHGAISRRTTLFMEAIPIKGSNKPNLKILHRWPALCQWVFFASRLGNPDWFFDPETTEVHVILTQAEADPVANPGRVQALMDQGVVVSCKNQWWYGSF